MVSSFLEAILIEAFGDDNGYVFVIYCIRIMYVYINLFCETNQLCKLQFKVGCAKECSTNLKVHLSSW